MYYTSPQHPIFEIGSVYYGWRRGETCEHFAMKLGRRLRPLRSFFLLGIFQCVKAKAYTCFHTQNHDVEIILSPPKKVRYCGFNYFVYACHPNGGRHRENLQEVRAEVTCLYPKTRVTCGLCETFFRHELKILAFLFTFKRL